MSATAWNLLQGGFIVGLLPFIIKFGKTDNLKIWAALFATYLLHQFTIWQYDYAKAYAIDAFFLVPFAVACFYLGASRAPFFYYLCVCLVSWAILCIAAFALSGQANERIMIEVVNVPIWVFGLLLIFSPPVGSPIDANFNIKQRLSFNVVSRRDNPARSLRQDNHNASVYSVLIRESIDKQE